MKILAKTDKASWLVEVTLSEVATVLGNPALPEEAVTIGKDLDVASLAKAFDDAKALGLKLPSLETAASNVVKAIDELKKALAEAQP